MTDKGDPLIGVKAKVESINYRRKMKRDYIDMKIGETKLKKITSGSNIYLKV